MQTGMTDTSAAERLKSFIEKKGLTYSQFADTCGIPRPSLSQILTGRNKKISDVVVGQIHNMFPELSIVWLLFGEGPMEHKSEENRSDNDERDDLDDENGSFSFNDRLNSDSKKIFFSGDGKSGSENGKENGLKISPELSKLAELKIDKLQNKIKEQQSKIDKMLKNPRRVVRVTVYYDDFTFEEFSPPGE